MRNTSTTCVARNALRRDRRSGIPRGKIKKISLGPGIAWDEFVIVTAKDIPGKNSIALITDDQPCLADGVVNHPEEPILLSPPRKPVCSPKSSRGRRRLNTTHCRHCSRLKRASSKREYLGDG